MSGLFDGTPLERPVTCANCELAMKDCTCPRDATGAVNLPRNQPARVRREKRKGGKVVTIITGLDPVATDLKALLKQLKNKCASGGTVGDATIELQGDHRDRLVIMLRGMGYPAKSAGG
jgi:translation initiation factor 1